MNTISIRVENLSKRYRIGGPQARYKTIRESLTEAVRAPFRRLSSIVRGQPSAVSNETIWALKDVTFEVKRGMELSIRMTDFAIRVENLSKQYRIGGPQGRFKYKTIRESLTGAVQAPFRRAAKLLRGEAYGAAEMNETIWALIEGRLLRGEAGRGGGHHWPQRGREDDAAQGPVPHHRTDRWLRGDPWAGGLAAGGGVLSLSKGGHRLPPRTDRAGEYHPERRYSFDPLRTGLGMKRAETCPEPAEGLSASSTRLWPLPRSRSSLTHR